MIKRSSTESILSYTLSLYLTSSYSLKLANLLLNDKMQVKVADFGLAAKLASDTEKRKTVCGTPHFMAPEVLDNSKGYSYPADIWSLGVIT